MLRPTILSLLLIAETLAVSLPLRTRVARGLRCEDQPLGSGPIVSPDTAAAFLNVTAFSDSALAAITPSGYYSTYTNLKAATNANIYLGFSTMNTYDAQTCASRCDSTDGCKAFNIYFERDPKQDPNDASCADPPSTTNIKCALWGDHVNQCNAVNTGQMRSAFQVAIAGSNGYVKQELATPAGYSCPTYLGDAAIDALSDCGGGYTFLGLEFFADGKFDIGRCADACTAFAARNLTTSNMTSDAFDIYQGSGAADRQCRFFNTYTLRLNGAVTGQYCALYNMTWSAATATNYGSAVAGSNYTIANSYSAGNASDPGLWRKWMS